jgi:hypothetical protein
MSAYICSDRQFATIAKYLFTAEKRQQSFADSLKRENVKSVNYRYREKTRVKKVDLASTTIESIAQYRAADILRLLACVDYQSCEHPDYDDTFFNMAERLLMPEAKKDPGSTVWSV